MATPEITPDTAQDELLHPEAGLLVGVSIFALAFFVAEILLLGRMV